MNIKTTFVDITDIEAVKAAVTDKTKVIYTETMGNPTLKIADIPVLAEIARKQGIKLVVDNTFSPLISVPEF
jgi:methionine-gamma-lyase